MNDIYHQDPATVRAGAMELEIATMTLRDEIREQPEAAARFLDRSLDGVRAVARDVSRRRPSFVLIAARGSSDHAAIYAQYALGLRNRLPVALAGPSMFSLYHRPPALDDALVVGISQSGQSPDIVAVLDEARRQGCLALAITNETDSPLANAADHVVALEAGPELAVAATKTYTLQLLAIAATSAALDDPDGDAERELRAVPDALAAAIATEPLVKARVEGVADAARAIVLGRGYEYGTAREWALKIQELSQVMAHSWSSADFEHGPLALVEPDLPILAVISDDVAGNALVGLLARLHDERRTKAVVVSSRDDAGALQPIRASRLPAHLAPIASIVPGQLFAYHLALARGLDPERPRAISKVTRTH